MGCVGGEDGSEKFDQTQVVWDEHGLAWHATSGLPVTGEVVKRWPNGVDLTEGHYVEGVRQGPGHRYYAPDGQALARREDDDLLRISTRYDSGELVERRAHSATGELVWSERWDVDGTPLATPAPPPLRDALASPDPATARSARRAVLDRGEQLRDRIRELTAAIERHQFMRKRLDRSGRPVGEQTADHRRHELAERELAPMLERANEELHVLQWWYQDWVPRVPVARCPYSARVVAFPIDNVDLDGWFWWYDRPVRPYHWDELPPTWLAMTGAMRLARPIAPVSFEARPGPEVPYVVPRILGCRDDVRAVIAEVPIGPHTGWAVTYFGLAPIADQLVSTWGEATYHWRSEDGDWHWEDGGWTTEYFDFEHGDNDYDLVPWLRSGKLLWIAPGDGELTLRDDETDCPYIGLAGSRHMTHLHDGQVWRTGP